MVEHCLLVFCLYADVTVVRAPDSAVADQMGIGSEAALVFYRDSIPLFVDGL